MLFVEEITLSLICIFISIVLPANDQSSPPINVIVRIIMIYFLYAFKEEQNNYRHHKAHVFFLEGGQVALWCIARFVA